MDRRLKDIRKRLIHYATGKFEGHPLLISSRLDEIDAIMTGINILGEELRSVTISRNYFNNIFNSVSDMVFLVNGKGIVQDMNKAAIEFTGCDLQVKPQLRMKDFVGRETATAATVFRKLKSESTEFRHQTLLLSRSGRSIPVAIKASLCKDQQGKDLLLLTATDISLQLQLENLIIRAIVDTQEMERKRLAKDLHDGLVQQLSAINFYISSTAASMPNGKHKKNLVVSRNHLAEAISEVRNICFNLMPKTLEDFGLSKAIQEFGKQLLNHTNIKLVIHEEGSFASMTPALKIDLYRVAQEFLNNSLQHSGAGQISVYLKQVGNHIDMSLCDNGCGFNAKRKPMGMGIKNVESRVKSHHGTMSITSGAQKGTHFHITIPIPENTLDG